VDTKLQVEYVTTFFRVAVDRARVQKKTVFWKYYTGCKGPLMVAQWLRYCATNRKVAGSIPDGVTGILH
jgi:hypothetical protein